MSKRCWTLQSRMEAQFAVSFYPVLLSNTKKLEILRRAEEIRAVRNEISELFFQHMLEFQDMSRFEAFNYFNPMFKDKLSSHYLPKAITDVWQAYQNRFDAIRRHIEFEKIVEIVRTFYKRNTKDHKKGDLKSIEKHTKRTKLTKTLTWLARYGNTESVAWLEKKLPEADKSKKKFYQMLLDYIGRFGFDRLMRLALARRERVYAEYKARGRIVFDSLTFNGRSRIKRPIVDKAQKPDGKFECYIEISWDWHDVGFHGEHKNTMCVPVKYNRKYHRNLKRYCNGTDTSYIIVIRGRNIHFVLTRDGVRYKHDDEITPENTVGIDVNSKHNMFALSTGEFIPNDTALIEDLERELRKVDEKQRNYNRRPRLDEAGESIVFKISRKDKARVEAISTKLNESNKRTIAALCEQLASAGIKHVVMENLNGFQGSRLFAKDAQGVNLGRLHLRTNLSSLKNEFVHIAPKYGIVVSLVQPEYTSKMCGHCGCIDDANRQTQEEFCCIECGHSENADVHSAKNIKFRLTSTVLRGNLLETAGDSGYSAFLPKSLPRWQVKKELEKCRSNGLFKQAVENHKTQQPATFRRF